MKTMNLSSNLRVYSFLPTARIELVKAEPPYQVRIDCHALMMCMCLHPFHSFLWNKRGCALITHLVRADVQATGAARNATANQNAVFNTMTTARVSARQTQSVEVLQEQGDLEQGPRLLDVGHDPVHLIRNLARGLPL